MVRFLTINVLTTDTVFFKGLPNRNIFHKGILYNGLLFRVFRNFFFGLNRRVDELFYLYLSIIMYVIYSSIINRQG